MLLALFWFTYTLWTADGTIKTDVVGPFDRVEVCNGIRDAQIARLEAIKDRDAMIEWNVTPGKEFPCESNAEARRPR